MDVFKGKFTSFLTSANIFIPLKLEQAMEETPFIWMDGKIVPWQEAKIHVLTHSLHYGSAVFEGIRFYDTEKGSVVFRLNEHINRLLMSAKVMKMQIPYSKNQIFNAIIELIRIDNIKSGYVRPIIYYGYGKMGLSVQGAPVNFAIAVWPWGAYLGEKPIKVGISKIRRIDPRTTISEAKISGHYANRILAGEEVRTQGYDEALLLDCQGNVAEGPGENFFLIKDGKLLTPKLGSILAGITRASIIQIAQDLGLVVEEKIIPPEDLYAADEAFFTGTAAEITLIESIDGRRIGSGEHPISNKLKEIYGNVVHGKVDRYKEWLSWV